MHGILMKSVHVIPRNDQVQAWLIISGTRSFFVVMEGRGKQTSVESDLSRFPSMKKGSNAFL